MVELSEIAYFVVAVCVVLTVAAAVLTTRWVTRTIRGKVVYPAEKYRHYHQ